MPTLFVWGALVLFAVAGMSGSPVRAADPASGHAGEKMDLPFAMTLPQGPHFPNRDFDLTKYGAVGDGRTLNTHSFEEAIADCAKAGGGRVVVPAGNWLTGSIHLRSNVNLYLSAGATILFSTDPKDYLPVVWVRWAGLECMNYSPLIYARDCENIAITGSGAIDGRGASWWSWAKKEKPATRRLYQMSVDNLPLAQRIFGRPEDALRPQLIEPIRCQNVLVEGVTILSGPFWTVQFAYCSQVIARHLTIRTVGPNNDGIDLDSCQDALVENCDVSAGDDCIALKSGVNEEGRRIAKPTERVVVRHCFTRAGHGGFVVGSETSGGIKDALAFDCDFQGTDRGIRIKSARGRGGVVENIWCRDLRMSGIKHEAILINAFYNAWLGAAKGLPPTLRNIHIDDIKVASAQIGISIDGLPELPIKNVSFHHCDIAAATGMTCAGVEGLLLDQVNIGGSPLF